MGCHVACSCVEDPDIVWEGGALWRGGQLARHFGDGEGKGQVVALDGSGSEFGGINFPSLVPALFHHVSQAPEAFRLPINTNLVFLFVLSFEVVANTVLSFAGASAGKRSHNSLQISSYVIDSLVVRYSITVSREEGSGERKKTPFGQWKWIGALGPTPRFRG
jgi:hypothetical protein